MRAGTLTEIIEPLRPVRRGSPSGSRTFDWESAGRWHAELQSSRGFRTVEAGELFADRSAVFLTRLSVPAGENWRLRHVGGYLYTIVGVERKRRLGMQILTCERVNE